MKKNFLPKLHKSLILVVAGCFLLSACAKEPITEIVQVPVYPEAPIVPKVTPVSLSNIDWILITEDNIGSIEEKLKNNPDLIYYALTPEGYIKLNSNLLDIMKILREQKQIIATYKEWSQWEN